MRLLPFINRSHLAAVQPHAPKKPLDLRYITLTNTEPPWTQPVSLYLFERIEVDKIWLICRPALDFDQETLPRFQLPGEEEFICFEQVDFSTLKTGDEFPLGQPGPMAGAIMFDFIIEEEKSPYTRMNMLALCPAELRAQARRIDLNPGSGSVEMNSSGESADATAKILAAIKDLKADVKSMETRVTKLETPMEKQKSTRARTVFFGDEAGESEHLGGAPVERAAGLGHREALLVDALHLRVRVRLVPEGADFLDELAQPLVGGRPRLRRHAVDGLLELGVHVRRPLARRLQVVRQLLLPLLRLRLRLGQPLGRRRRRLLDQLLQLEARALDLPRAEIDVGLSSRPAWMPWSSTDEQAVRDEVASYKIIESVAAAACPAGDSHAAATAWHRRYET